MEPPLDLARFAAICAGIDAGEPEASAAKRAGLSLDAWRSAEEEWLCRIAGEPPQARLDLTRRFNEAFSRQRRLLGGRLPEVSADPSGEEARPTPAPPPAAAEEQGASRPAALPSFMRAGASDAARPAALPSFMRVQSPSGPRLTLEQFAALIAELAAAARPPVEIRARHGLDEAAHSAEAAAWQHRFAADPALQTRWLALFSVHRHRLAPRR